MTPSEVALEAARIMSERGHCKNVLFDDEGRVCYHGALLAVLGEKSWSSASSEIQQLIMQIDSASLTILRERGYSRSANFRFPYSSGSITAFSVWEQSSPVTFNNDESVTKEDVVTLLKETAERLTA